MLLNKPDLTTAARTALAINQKFGVNIAKAIDGASVKVNVPNVFADDFVLSTG